MTEARATLRYHRATAPKARQVLGLIRGTDVEEARQRLRFSEKSAAGPVLKLLESAISNAENKHQVPPDELFVSAAYAHEGPTYKRFRPRARGRAARVRKRTCHITIVVERFTDEQQQERARRDELKVKGGKTKRQPLRRRRRIQTDEHEHAEDAEAGTQTTGELVEEKPEAAEVLEEEPKEKPKRRRVKKTEASDEEKPKRSRRKPKEGE